MLNNEIDYIAELQYVIDALNRCSDASAIHSLAAFIAYIDATVPGFHIKQRVRGL